MLPRSQTQPAIRLAVVALFAAALAIDSFVSAGRVRAAEDLMLKTRVEPVDVEIFIPQEARPVQGLLVHVFNHRLRSHGRWVTLCRELKWAHINTIISRKANNRPKKIRHAIYESLQQFADQTGLPELVHVPRTGVGFSAGGMAVNVLETEPHLMLTNAISCSWVRDPAIMGGAAAIPELFIIGAVPDAFEMLPAIEKHFEPAIKQGRPWCLGLQHQCKHDWANSGTLSVAWIQSIAKLRYPDRVDPTKPIPLRPLPFQEGWRGNRSTIDGTMATVVDAADFRGTEKTTTWLPDRAFAYVWRAWQTKDSPVDLTVRTADGSKRLPPFDPRKSFGMSIDPGVPLVLGVSPKREVPISNVQFYHGDSLIGGAASAPWEIKWSSKRIGCYPIWAQYLREETPAVTNPALICFEPLND
jgi:hypothetical protein